MWDVMKTHSDFMNPIILVLTVSFILLTAFGEALAGYALSDTGQTTCYDEYGSQITCPTPGSPFSGQDASYSGAHAGFYFENGNIYDNRVFDKNTGLVWQRSDVQNNPPDYGFNWEDAAAYCRGLTLPLYPGQIGGWRLPTPMELNTLIDFGLFDPAIDRTFFGACKSGTYWTSTSSPENPETQAWAVSFLNGASVPYNDKERNFYVRCVAPGTPLPYGGFRVSTTNARVFDLATGLVWQRVADEAGRNWEESLAYCEDLVIDHYEDWRLPNIRELESIVDHDRRNPAISIAFVGASGSYYSSTSFIFSSIESYYVWIVDFSEGNTTYTHKGLNRDLFVRCVRGGQGDSFDSHVSKTGNCGGKSNCYNSLQTAVNSTVSGAVIHIAEGTYSEQITLNSFKVLTFKGGWDPDFKSQTPNATIIKSPQVPQGSLTLQMLCVRP